MYQKNCQKIVETFSNKVTWMAFQLQFLSLLVEKNVKAWSRIWHANEYVTISAFRNVGTENILELEF